MKKRGYNLRKKGKKGNKGNKGNKNLTPTNSALSFGKYKGRTIEECPSSYLLYITENFDDGYLCYEAHEEYQLREKYNTHWEENE